MSKARKAASIIIGILMLLLSLVIFGMVGGRTILFQNIVLLDLGIFTVTMINIPNIYVLIYLCAIYCIDAGISIYGALEAKKLESPHWKLKLSGGVIRILVLVLGFIFLSSTSTLVDIYAIGLFVSGIQNIGSAVRRTEIVYIQ